MRLDIFAGFTNKYEEGLLKAQLLIEGADRIRVDSIQKECSLPKPGAWQTQNAPGREVGVSHGDEDNVLETGGFNLRGSGYDAVEQRPQMIRQIQPMQVAFQGFDLEILDWPEGRVFGPEPGDGILVSEVL